MDALASLAGQTHRDFEVVLVDMSDGSMQEKIEACHAQLPRLLHLRPPGLLSRPAALNYAIERAQGHYIGVLDDDNYYEPPHLEVLRKGVDQSGTDLIYTGVIFRTFTSEGQLVSEERLNDPFDFQRFLSANYLFCSATVYAKEAWKRVGGYDLRFPVYEDWEFLIRLTQTASVVTLSGYSAVSRSFTGQAGVPEHHRELEECHRCMTGVRWKHRKLFGAATREHFQYREAIELLVDWRRRNRSLRTEVAPI